MTYRVSVFTFLIALLAAVPTFAQDDVTTAAPVVALVGCVADASGGLDLLFADAGRRTIDAASCSEALSRAERKIGKRAFVGVLTLKTPGDGDPVLVWSFGVDGNGDDTTDGTIGRVGVGGCELDPAGFLLPAFVDLPGSDHQPPGGLSCAGVLTRLARDGFDEARFLAIVPAPGAAHSEETLIWELTGTEVHVND